MNTLCEKNEKNNSNVDNDTTDGFVKYGDPIKLTKNCHLVNEGKIPVSDLPLDFCKMMTSSSIDEKTRKVLHEVFPVRISRVGDDTYASFVQEKQASPIEIYGLLNDIKMAFVHRAANDYPLCSIREEILYSVSRELLRQLIIECPERGMLFKQVLDEQYKHFEAYKILFKHNEAFLSRKNIQAAYIKKFQMEQVRVLEEEIEDLKHKVKTLEETAERMKKKFQEEAISAENKRQDELRYENMLTEQLKVLDVTMSLNRLYRMS